MVIVNLLRINADEIFVTTIDNPVIAKLINSLITGQLESGQDGEGNKLSDNGGDYSPSYAAFKGVNPSDVDLNLTGKFYKSIKAVTSLDEFTITADYIKGNYDLRIRWGNEIAKLSDDSIKILTKAIQKEICKIIEKIICRI